LAGSDLAYDALFDRDGVIRVETLDELAATLLLLSAERRVGRGGLVAIGDSGGERELLIDLADRAGVPFAAISEATKASIAARLEPGLEAANPLDAWGTGADFVPSFSRCFGDLLADPEAALGLFSADIRDGYYLHRGFAVAALAAARESDKIVAVATNYTQVRHDALALELTLAGIPVLDGTANALAAVRGALSYRDFRQRSDDPPPLPPAARAADRQAAWARLREATRPLDEAVSLSLLETWGLPAIPHVVVESPEEARRAGARLGYPVACKTATPGIPHKSDVDGVRLALADEQALLEAYADLSSRLGPRTLIAAMATRGVELSLGMVRDPQFGPIVVVAAGGVLIELIDDRRAALAPFGPVTARRLLDGLKIRRLLDGYRGGVAVDMDRLAHIVSLFSVLAAELADLVAEIDINPLVAGGDIVALDALVIAQPRPC
jgi:acyl-CoA synthetase (NDP forming)